MFHVEQVTLASQDGSGRQVVLELQPTPTSDLYLSPKYRSTLVLSVQAKKDGAATKSVTNSATTSVTKSYLDAFVTAAAAVTAAADAFKSFKQQQIHASSPRVLKTDSEMPPSKQLDSKYKILLKTKTEAASLVARLKDIQAEAKKLPESHYPAGFKGAVENKINKVETVAAQIRDLTKEITEKNNASMSFADVRTFIERSEILENVSNKNNLAFFEIDNMKEVVQDLIPLYVNNSKAAFDSEVMPEKSIPTAEASALERVLAQARNLFSEFTMLSKKIQKSRGDIRTNIEEKIALLNAVATKLQTSILLKEKAVLAIENKYYNWFVKLFETKSLTGRNIGSLLHDANVDFLRLKSYLTEKNKVMFLFWSTLFKLFQDLQIFVSSTEKTMNTSQQSTFLLEKRKTLEDLAKRITQSDNQRFPHWNGVLRWFRDNMDSLQKRTLET